MGGRKPVSFSTEPELWEAVKQAAARKGKKASDIVNEALHQYLYNGPTPTHLLKSFQQELAEVSGQLHVERARANALTKEVKSLRRLISNLTATFDKYAKEVATIKAEAANLKAREQAVSRREVAIARKEAELRGWEEALRRREGELKALQEHIKQKEEEVARKEQLAMVAIGQISLPKWVADFLRSNDLNAVSMKDLVKKYDLWLVFTDEELEQIVEKWPIIAETQIAYIKDAGAGLHYRQLKDKKLAGFFVWAENDPIEPHHAE